MTTLRAAFRARLTGDTTLNPALPTGTPLMSILTGGVHDADSLGRQGLTPSAALRAADGVTLLPTAVIRWSTSGVYGLRHAERRFVFVWFYADKGGAVIEQAKLRVKALLHRHPLGVTATDKLGLNFVNWVGDVDDLVAEELQDAAAAYSRFTVDLTRR